MPSIKLSIPHSLDEDEVRNRINSELETLVESYAEMVNNLSHAWSGATLNVSGKSMGFGISAEAEILSAEVMVRAKVPLAALPLKSRAERLIRQRLGELLA